MDPMFREDDDRTVCLIKACDKSFIGSNQDLGSTPSTSTILIVEEQL